jgi:hypothetical protein
MRIHRRILVLAAGLTVALTGTGAGAAQAEEDQPAAGRQLLFYNHAYGVVDRETADAVEHSAYIREFANFEVRTTTGSGVTWTGRYLYGRETYFELFGVGDLPGAEFGTVGMGVSTEREGDFATVIERLRGQGIAPIEFQQARDFGDGEPVPWYDAIITTDQFDRFGIWGMQWRQEYFADPRGNTDPPSFPGDIGRERYLTDGYAEHLMRDVTGIRIAVTEADLTNALPLLRTGGFVVQTFPGGAVALRGGTTIRFDAVPRAQVGLKQVEFALNRSVPRHEEQLGRSTLVVGPGARAVWTFAGPA